MASADDASPHEHSPGGSRVETGYSRRRPELTVLHRVVRERFGSAPGDGSTPNPAVTSEANARRRPIGENGVEASYAFETPEEADSPGRPRLDRLTRGSTKSRSTALHMAPRDRSLKPIRDHLQRRVELGGLLYFEFDPEEHERDRDRFHAVGGEVEDTAIVA